MNIYLFNPPRKNGDTHFVIDNDGQLYATGSMFECEMAMMELKGTPMVFSHYRQRKLDPEDVGIVTFPEVSRCMNVLNCIYTITSWESQLTLETALDAMCCLDRCTRQDLYKPKE